MVANKDVRCVLVKVHGIGNQQITWHEAFDELLSKELASLTAKKRSLFVNEAVYWADLSMLPGLPGAMGGASFAQPSATSPAVAVEMQYGYVYQSYANYLASGGDAARATPAAFGFPDPRTVFVQLRNGIVSAADQANDVARYVADNGARAQILHRLSRKLFDVHDTYPNATIMLGSHSQGTILSYDVLRLAGSRLPRLKIWITMGSPLEWYTKCGLWGRDRLDISAELTWINLFDPGDAVGKALAPLVEQWGAPLPADIDVGNARAGLHPHDHWHNPTVASEYARHIRALVDGA